MLRVSATSLHDGFVRMAAAARDAGVPSTELRESWPASGGPPRPGCWRSPAGSTPIGARSGRMGLLTGAAALGTDDPCRTAASIALRPDPAVPARLLTHGALARLRYGSGGARTEAVNGFPHVRLAYTTLCAARARGAPRPGPAGRAHGDGGPLQDTCLLHRGGREGLALARNGARRVLRAGGTATRRVDPGSPNSTPRSPRAGCRPAAAPTSSPPPSTWTPLTPTPPPGADDGTTQLFLPRSHPGPASRPRRCRRFGRPRGARRTRRPCRRRRHRRPAHQRRRVRCAWQAVLERFFSRADVAVTVQIHDFGATPGAVSLRLSQAVEAAR